MVRSSQPSCHRYHHGAAAKGLWRGYFLVCPKGPICWAPVAVTQAGGGSSALTLLCAKNQTKENCEHRSQGAVVVHLDVAGRPENFLVDTGATYSVLIPLSGAFSSQTCTILGATGKAFQLYVHEREGIALGVLTQRLGSEPQPVAYLPKRLDPTVQGWPPAFKILQPLQS